MTEISAFKKYYNNPEFRKKHLEYCSEKIKCECGAMICRNSFTHHRKTKKHQELLKLKENTEENQEELLSKIASLEKELQKAKKKN